MQYTDLKVVKQHLFSNEWSSFDC